MNINENYFLDDKLQKEIELHLIIEYPNEGCGFILKDNTYIPCTNIHETPETNFKICPTEYYNHSKNIKHIIHSHVKTDKTKNYMADLRSPSPSDMEGCKSTNIPWLIFGVEMMGNKVRCSPPLKIPREPNNEYLKRRFAWFVDDCYTIVQDYYSFEYGIILTEHCHDFEHNDIRLMYKMFEPYIDDSGFIEVTGQPLQKGDLGLTSYLGGVENHIGVYVGDNNFLHQSGLSRYEPVESFLDYKSKIYRHKELMND